jgi:hypothetical protein
MPVDAALYPKRTEFQKKILFARPLSVKFMDGLISVFVEQGFPAAEITVSKQATEKVDFLHFTKV